MKCRPPLIAIPLEEWWRVHAACAGMDRSIFFAHDAEPARAVCRRCEVRASCLDFALRVHERHGLWGGLTPEERDHERRRRALTPGGGW